jgi:hypothetical protein
MNDTSYKNKIVSWVENHAIVNHFNDFFTSNICAYKGTSVVLTSQNNRDKERIKRVPEGTSSASSSNRTKSTLPSTESSKRSIREYRSSAATSPSKKIPEVMKVDIHVMSSKASPNPKGCNRNQPLCVDCCNAVPTRRQGRVLNLAKVEIVVCTPRSEFQLCFFHAKKHYVYYSTDPRFDVSGDIDEIFQSENRDTEFVNDQKEYSYTNVTYLTRNIAAKLHSNISPVKSCAENQGLRMECPSDCEGGDSCQNKQLSFLRSLNNFDKRLVRKPTNTDKGDGLFAEKDYSPGELMIEFTGQAFLYENGKKFPDSNYIMHLQNNCYIDAEHYGNLSRFINHSCDPNTTVEKYLVRLRLWVTYNSFRK